MILLYGTWYDILGMIYSSAAAYFIAIRSQFRMRSTHRKQREEGEAKREPDRVRESKKEDRDKTRTARERVRMIQQSNSVTPDLRCMILLYDTWHDILGMIYSSAAAYFIATSIRSQFRMRRRLHTENREKREKQTENQRE